MQIYKTCLLLLVLSQLSYQYCHYSEQINPTNGICSCITGFYSDNQNCLQCDTLSTTSEDTLYPSLPSDCSICTLGTRMILKAFYPGQGAVCASCPNNSYSKQGYSKLLPISSCQTCQSGYYKVSNAIIDLGDNPPSEAVCQKCPNNTFRTTDPDPNIQDPNDNVCYQCSDGFYMNTRLTPSQNAQCSLCPNNSTQLQIAVIQSRFLQGVQLTFTSKDCNACIIGYYNAETDPSKPVNCQKCPGNTTTLEASNGDISTCICSQNQYTTAISSSSAAASCSPCPTGSGKLVKNFNVVGDESQCDVCLEGYYLITPYQESDGTSPAKGAQCQICPQNSYSIAGTSTSPSSCSLCKINYKMTKASDFTNNSAQCQLCPSNTGTLAPASALTDVCNVCIAGYFMLSPFNKDQTPQCQQCPPGSNTNPGINTVCYCYDQYASWSSSTQSCQCNPGYIGSPATSLNAQGCTPCPAGQYSSSRACVTCPAGTYSNSPGSGSCTKCTSGKYASGTGNTSCSACPNLSNSLDDFTGCKCIDTSAIYKDGNCACPDGYEGAPSNSANTQGCQACVAGKYSNSSTSGKCTVCSVGTYAAGTANSNCKQCDVGQYASNTGSSSCQQCGPGFTNSKDYSSCSCIDSNATQTQNNSSCVCNPGYIGSPATSQDSSSKCTACPAGQFVDSGKCSPCAVGTFSSNTANATCTKCEAGQFANGTGNTKCQTCPPGSAHTDDFSGCKCYDQNSVTWNASSNVCQCNSNYYGDASKATETQKSQCIVCPNNSSSKVGAAKTKNDCQVSQSQYNGQYSYSTMIKISILIFLILLL